MAKIYKRSDRIPVKIDDIQIVIAPLGLEQKTEIQDCMARGHIKRDYALLQKAISDAIRYAVKDISGVEDAEGNPYKLTFDEAGNLTEECVSDLYNLEMHPKLVMVCSALVKRIPQQFTDELGVPLEGVEIIASAKKEDVDPN